MRLFTRAALGGLCGLTCLVAGTGPPGPPGVRSQADVLDLRGVGFQTPDCVVWDKDSDVYLVSNIHGHPQDKDDNGFISRVRPDGTVEALKWIDGASEGVTLHAPKGMAITRDNLWVADIDVMRRFERRSGRLLGEIAVKNAKYLDEVLPGWPDPNASPGVIDTALWRESKPGEFPPGRPRMVGLEPAPGETGEVTFAKFVATIFTEFMIVDSGLSTNETVLAQARRDYQSDQPCGQITGATPFLMGLALVSWDRDWLYLLHVHDRGCGTQAIRLPQAQLYDVLDVLYERHRLMEDQSGEWWGHWFVSSWAGRCVYHVRMREPHRATVTEWVSGVRAPGKLGYDAKRNRVLIPLYLDNALLIRPGPGHFSE